MITATCDITLYTFPTWCGHCWSSGGSALPDRSVTYGIILLIIKDLAEWQWQWHSRLTNQKLHLIQRQPTRPVVEAVGDCVKAGSAFTEDVATFADVVVVDSTACRVHGCTSPGTTRPANPGQCQVRLTRSAQHRTSRVHVQREVSCRHNLPAHDKHGMPNEETDKYRKTERHSYEQRGELVEVPGSCASRGALSNCRA